MAGSGQASKQMLVCFRAVVKKLDSVPAHRGERRGIRVVRIAAAQTKLGAGEGGRQIKRKRLEANAVLNTKDIKLHGLPSLITIMKTSSRQILIGLP